MRMQSTVATTSRRSSARRDQILYDTDGERTQLEFYREDSLKDIADSAPYMCVKVDGCPGDTLNGETDTGSISAWGFEVVRGIKRCPARMWAWSHLVVLLLFELLLKLLRGVYSCTANYAFFFLFAVLLFLFLFCHCV